MIALVISTNERAEQLLPVFYEALVKNFEVTIFCPASVKDYICRCYPENQYKFFNFSAPRSFLTNLISDLRTHTLINYNLTPAIAWRIKTILKTAGFYSKLVFFLSRILRKIKLFRNNAFWNKIERAFIRDWNLNREFGLGNYDLILFPNPVLAESELRVFYEAKRRGLKIVSLDEAFFEFSGKFHSFRPMDKTFAWCKESIEEAEKLHNIRPEKFEVAGPVRFDLYYRPDLFPSREEFNRHFDLNPQDKLITFTLNRYPVNKTVVKIICNAVRNGSLPPGTKLLVRFAPKDTRDASLNQIENLKKEFLGADGEGILKFDIAQDSDFCKKNMLNGNFIGRDILHFGSVLKYSDAVLCINSTVIVEAHIFNTPAFYIGFTIDRGQIREADYAKWGQIPRVLKYGRNFVVFTSEELIDNLNRALRINKEDPAWQSKCDNFVKSFMTFNDGKTSERIISSLKNAF